MTRLVMYENDTPEDMVEAFCDQYDVEPKKRITLLESIRAHLNKVIVKIEETSDE